MSAFLNSVAKALTAFVVAGYAAYIASTLASSTGGSSVTRDEWVGLIVAGVVAGFAVWAIPNTSTSSK
jgi:NO-binding membrane sensor protein with MHYT domain